MSFTRQKARFIELFALLSIVVLFCNCQKSPHLENIQKLTSEGDNGEAYFSPDGKKLIWQSDRGGYACDKIWIMNIDGSNKHMVSGDIGAHTCSFFFPDGKRIIYSSTRHTGEDCPPKPKPRRKFRFIWPLYPYEIYSADVDGSNVKRLTFNPGYDAEGEAISSDGKKIVFTSKREGDLDVYIMNSDGSNVTRLTDRYGYDGGSWFSPDDKQIVWRAWYPETEEEISLWNECMENDYIVGVSLDIYVMNADGSDVHRLTDNGATNWSPSWHPDGKRIIFSSNMDDWREEYQAFGHNFELYIMNKDGSNLHRITHNEVFDSFPMFSPDGKKLAFASNRRSEDPHQTNIFIADWVE